MSKGEKAPVSPLSRAISAEVRSLAARENWNREELSRRCGIKVGRLGYLLREEAPWNILEIDRVSGVFELMPSELLAQAEEHTDFLISTYASDLTQEDHDLAAHSHVDREPGSTIPNES